MNLRIRPFHTILCSAVLAQCAGSALATQVRDLVRLKGHEQNELIGLGVVVGLNGTGDSSKESFAAARPYAALLENLGNPVLGIEELAEYDAYAIVAVSMTIPASGAREGDRIDVAVSSMFNAESLEGGRLVMSMLRVPLPDAPDLLPLASASGPIVLQGTNPRVGIIRGGGQMLADIRTNHVAADGTMTVVLKDQYASYPIATTVANAINDEFYIGDGYADLAVVEDARNIRILVPAADRSNPARFIASLQTIPVDPSLLQSEARIVVNEVEGIIVVTGNVEIGPVGIAHQGLTITSVTPVSPIAGGTPPPNGSGQWRGLATTQPGTRSATRLQELLSAFDQLAVPVDDQIAIIYELKKTGALHAEIVSQ